MIAICGRDWYRIATSPARRPACFEPALDYVVVKVPRFAFEKFPMADQTLTTTMKCVGEAMAIGRNFTEALQKALRSIESKDGAFAWTGERATSTSTALIEAAQVPHDGRLHEVQQALWAGATVERAARGDQHRPLVPRPDRAAQRGRRRAARAPRSSTPTAAPGQAARLLRRADRRDRAACPRTSCAACATRSGVRPVYKTVDTCAAEFAARRRTTTPPTTKRPRSSRATSRQVLILGSGPNRIGQGIEFDYSCVHAASTLREAGYETVMVNCNPETVSTDYDTSDRLYFEPLTLEDVLEVYTPSSAVGPVAGVIVQLGGQTPLGLAQPLKDAGVPIVGTSPEAIHLAEERGAFGRVLAEAGLPAPAARHRHAASTRPWRSPTRSATRCSCGRRTCSAVAAWRSSTTRRCCATTSTRATEVDARAPGARRPLPRRRGRDRRRRPLRRRRAVPRRRHGAHRGGRHPLRRLGLRPAADHARATGDRAHPPPTEAIAAGVGVRGLLNVQYALAGDVLYVLEANPRASRTVPVRRPRPPPSRWRRPRPA